MVAKVGYLFETDSGREHLFEKTMVIDLGLDDDEAKTVEGEWRKRFDFPRSGKMDVLWFSFTGENIFNRWH